MRVTECDTQNKVRPQASGRIEMICNNDLTWSDVWSAADESDAVESYDMDTHEITWCDGTTSTPVGPIEALNEIAAMSAT